jgi:hypothetical protein
MRLLLGDGGDGERGEMGEGERRAKRGFGPSSVLRGAGKKTKQTKQNQWDLFDEKKPDGTHQPVEYGTS